MAKPKRIGVPIADIRRAKSELGDYAPLAYLMMMTTLLEGALEREEITPIEFVIADLDQYYDAYKRGGITVDQLNEVISLRTDLPSVLVPVWYVETLMAGFTRYISRKGELELGEAFGLEKGGQGKRRKIDRVRNLIRDFKICDMVDGRRADAEEAGFPISAEQAFEAVADAWAQAHPSEALSVDTIRRAYTLYGKRVRDAGVSTLIWRATS